MPLDPADGFPTTPESLVIAAGTNKMQAHQFAVDLDIAMRKHYAINLKNLARKIYPVLYAEATFDGGRYTLSLDPHTTYVCQETGPVYTQLKAVAHIPLAIYSVIFPYMAYSENKQWVAPLTALKSHIENVRASLPLLDFTSETASSSREIVEAALQFCDTLIGRGSFSIQDYRNFCYPLGEAILLNQTAAAVSQVEGMRAYLLDWKRLVGEDVWDRMYVVCSCIWTVSQESAQEQIVKSTMKRELWDTHVIASEAVPTLDDARLLLARILADRVLAAAVFDKAVRPEYAQNIYSLSSQRDLLAKSIEAVLGGGSVASLCPFAAGR